MQYYRNPHFCQADNSVSAVIIVPDVFYTHSSFIETQCTAKHLMVLCHLLLQCWLKADRPKLDSLLYNRPLKAKMIKLDYITLGEVFDLSKAQLQETIRNLEEAKLLNRVSINNQWYIILTDKAITIYFNNSTSKKHRINKGNVIATEWFKLVKTDSGQTDFTGILALADIVYKARVFERKDEDDNTILVSKSSGLVPYFESGHFHKKFSFLDKRTINRAIERLVSSNIISIEVKKFSRSRRVIKRSYITPNYQLINREVNHHVVDFTFKIPEHLNPEQLAIFDKNYNPSLYKEKYNNKTIIYPCPGNLDNSSFFAQEKQEEQEQKDIDKIQHDIQHNIQNRKESGQKDEQDNQSPLNTLTSPVGKKRAFRKPRALSELKPSLKRLYRPYFSSFGYPEAFCQQLLDSLSKKYPDHNFKAEKQFIKYFRLFLSQERRAPWQVRNMRYFNKAKSLKELAFDQLSVSLREKLKKLAVQFNQVVEELPNLLARLAINGAKHLFASGSAFLKYMKQVLEKLKSKDEMKTAYAALPRTNIAVIGQYLSHLEGSYYKIGPDEHLKRKLAATLPMTIAYHLLNFCNFTTAHFDKKQNFIIPSKNKNWAELMRSGIKQIIKEQIAAVYGQVKAIKFVPFWTKAKLEVAQNNENKNEKKLEITKSNQNNQENNQDDSKSPPRLSEPHVSEYMLFHKKRLEQEQEAKEAAQAKLEQEVKEALQSERHDSEGHNNENTEVSKLLESYNQAVEQTSIDKQNFLNKGGAVEVASKMFVMPSFKEWMQIQELLRLV